MRLLIVILIGVTAVVGSVVYVSKDSAEARAFVAMSKAIITQDTSIFEHSEPPEIFGSATVEEPDRYTGAGEDSVYNTDKQNLLEHMFGGGQEQPNKPRRLNAGDTSGGSSLTDRAFGRQPDNSGTFMPSRALDSAEAAGKGDETLMPRDFTVRGRQQSTSRRIRVGD